MEQRHRPELNTAIGRGRTWQIHFDSLPEMIERAQDRADVLDLNKPLYDSLARMSRHFTNGYSLSRVNRELGEPPECSAEVRELTDWIESEHQFQENKRKMRHKMMDGDELDPVAWATGDPEGWSKVVKEPRANNVVRIGVNIVVHAEQTPRELFYRGAAAAALADALEASGHSTEIVLFESARGKFEDGDDWLLSCTLKAPTQPLEINTIALALSEIGFFRTAVFHTDVAVAHKEVEDSLGKPNSMPDTMAQEYDILFEQSIKSYEQARETVEKYAEQFDA